MNDDIKLENIGTALNNYIYTFQLNTEQANALRDLLGAIMLFLNHQDHILLDQINNIGQKQLDVLIAAYSPKKKRGR